MSDPLCFSGPPSGANAVSEFVEGKLAWKLRVEGGLVDVGPLEQGAGHHSIACLVGGMVLALGVDVFGLALVVLLGREGADRVLTVLAEIEQRDAVLAKEELAELIPSRKAAVVGLDEGHPAG